MPALKPIPFFRGMRNLVLMLLVGVLFLTSSAFVKPQGQTPDPLAKRFLANGIQSDPVPAGESPAEPADLLPLGETNLVQDPSFEASYLNETYWHSVSLNFPTTLCTPGVCGNGAGTAGPRTGNVWAWFGGVPWDEQASLSQVITTFPSCGATLQFYFWIGAATAGSDANDRFFVKIDNQQVFAANATQKNLYPGYKLVSVNANAFADGRGHQITFWAYTSDQLVTFNLDDVSLFSGPCVSISGNAGMGLVTLSYNNVIPRTLLTPGNGNYLIKVPLHWSGKITPSQAFSGAAFSPASRSYANLTMNQTAQNYTPMWTVSGDVGVAGATLSYTDGAPRTATSLSDGSYSIRLPHHWNGTITPTHPCFTFDPTEQSVANLGGNVTLPDYTATFIPGSGCADVSVGIGGADLGRFGTLVPGSTRASFAGVDKGPVKIESTNAVPILGAERLIYKVNNVATSFSEMMALPNSQLDNIYWLPWYNNVGLNTQLRLANVSDTDATVQVTIGGVEMGAPFTLTPGASKRLSYAGIDKGPVKIESNVNIVAAERVIYNVNGVNTSFTEMMAFPNSQLDTIYWLPWYNNVSLDTQLRIANVSDTDANVHVTIGGVEMTGSPFTLTPGASKRLNYPGIDKGPVKIESDVDIVAAERVIYKVDGVNTSFGEMLALPNTQLASTYVLPWYNSKSLDTQLRIANVSDTDATVHVFIGGVEMGSPFTLTPGASKRLSFPNVDKGPVKIESDVDIVAAERVIYKVNNIATSFSEMMGLPAGHLDLLFWLPWYNNKDLDTQLRFGVP